MTGARIALRTADQSHAPELYALIAANLEEGHLWPIAFALTKLTAAEEARIAVLVKKAAN